MPSSDSNRSATALRALRVLEILGDAREPVSVAAVAHELGADRSTAYRMLITLMEAGYVTRDEQTRSYQLGYRLLSLSRNLLKGDERSELILEAMREISAATRETVHYAVLDGDATVLVLRVKGSQLVSVDFQIGDRSPLHCTSIGKVLMAYQDPRFVEEVIARGLPKVAPNTITDPDALRRALARARADGYAYDDLEFADDMRCVAVPIFQSGGVVRGGISLSGPASRYTRDKLDALRDITMASARRLSQQLGGLAYSDRGTD
jgi:DNA-binding IclR family transcriptional regulator